jgi:hypothetical protein
MDEAEQRRAGERASGTPAPARTLAVNLPRPFGFPRDGDAVEGGSRAHGAVGREGGPAVSRYTIRPSLRVPQPSGVPERGIGVDGGAFCQGGDIAKPGRAEAPLAGGVHLLVGVKIHLWVKGVLPGEEAWERVSRTRRRDGDVQRHLNHAAEVHQTAGPEVVARNHIQRGDLCVSHQSGVTLSWALRLHRRCGALGWRCTWGMAWAVSSRSAGLGSNAAASPPANQTHTHTHIREREERREKKAAHRRPDAAQTRGRPPPAGCTQTHPCCLCPRDANESPSRWFVRERCVVVLVPRGDW